MLFKLALRNAKRQISNYVIYFITVTLTVALIFAVNNIIFSDLMKQLQEDYLSFLQPLLLGLSGILSIVVAFVLSYVTAFLLRRRKKEFGLYLTMGMTRGNILALFAGETAVTFVISLGFGLLIGLGAYQALMAIFINFLELEYAVGSYSAKAFLITVLMVVGMFVLSSIASLGYLRFAKISKLLHGDKTVEKTAKPIQLIIWLALSAVGLVLLIISLVSFPKWLLSDDFFNRIGELVGILLMFIASLILLPMSVSKSVVPLIVNRNAKTCSAKGTAVFTMRQLSGRLSANAVLTGVLTFLLVIAIIFPNIFITQNRIIASEVRYWYPFDIRMDANVDYREPSKYEPYEYEQEIQTISKYAKIEEAFQYVIYGYDYSQYEYMHVIRESDYNKLCTMLGEKTVQLNGGFLTCYEEWCYNNEYYDGCFDVDELTLGGVTYSKEGEQACLTHILSSGEVISCFAVIPDGAVNKNVTELRVRNNFLAVTLKSPHYDARGLRHELSGLLPSEIRFRNDSLREYERLDELTAVGLFLLGCLFVSSVFVLMSMAMLALKMLTMLEEDKARYKTLWRLGADKRMIFRSLFSQMFFFYFLPFALPFILSGVIGEFLSIMVKKQYGTAFAISSAALFGQTVAFTGVILALYALYFTVTYLIARRDIKRTLQSVG